MRAVGQVTLAVLVAFHAWLLWTHFAGGRLFDLATVARWLVSVGALVGFRALRRHGVSLFWGKRAVVLWLLVVLIHCHAVWNGQPVSLAVGVPETLEIFAKLAAPLVLVSGLLLATALRIQESVLGPCWLAGGRSPHAAGFLPPGFTLRFFPRPPPVA